MVFSNSLDKPDCRTPELPVVLLYLAICKTFPMDLAKTRSEPLRLNFRADPERYPPGSTGLLVGFARAVEGIMEWIQLEAKCSSAAPGT